MLKQDFARMLLTDETHTDLGLHKTAFGLSIWKLINITRNSLTVKLLDMMPRDREGEGNDRGVSK